MILMVLIIYFKVANVNMKDPKKLMALSENDKLLL